jgi:hypothetical protein
MLMHLKWIANTDRGIWRKAGILDLLQFVFHVQTQSHKGRFGVSAFCVPKACSLLCFDTGPMKEPTQQKWHRWMKKDDHLKRSCSICSAGGSQNTPPPIFSSQNTEVVTFVGKCVTQCCLSIDTTIQTNIVCGPAGHYPIYNLYHSTHKWAAIAVQCTDSTV